MNILMKVVHTEWQKISGFSGEEFLKYVQTIGSLLTEKFDVEAAFTSRSILCPHSQ